MRRTINVIWIISCTFICSNIFAANESKSLVYSQLPKFDIEANIGIVWLSQVAGNININDNIYTKVRLSRTFLASEKSLLFGYQYLLDSKYRVQLGLGYTKGIIYAFFNDKDDNFSAGTFEVRVIHFFSTNRVRFGINYGWSSIIRNKNNTIPNMNIGLIIGLF